MQALYNRTKVGQRDESRKVTDRPSRAVAFLNKVYAEADVHTDEEKIGLLRKKLGEDLQIAYPPNCSAKRHLEITLSVYEMAFLQTCR